MKIEVADEKILPKEWKKEIKKVIFFLLFQKLGRWRYNLRTSANNNVSNIKYGVSIK